MAIQEQSSTVSAAIASHERSSLVLDQSPRSLTFVDFPSSWYFFCVAQELEKGPVSKHMLGTDLVAHRTVSGQIAGRMLTEVESPDQPTLEKWFARRNINIEWMMRVDLDASDGEVKEY